MYLSPENIFRAFFLNSSLGETIKNRGTQIIIQEGGSGSDVGTRYQRAGLRVVTQNNAIPMIGLERQGTAGAALYIAGLGELYISFSDGNTYKVNLTKV